MASLGILFANLGPYHVARVTGVSQCKALASWKTIAIELAREEEEYNWKINLENLSFSVITIANDKPLEQQNKIVLLFRLWQKLEITKPDVLCISGYARLPMIAALVWCKIHHSSAILMSDSTVGDAQRYQWREIFKSFIVRQFDAALVGGLPQAHYLHLLGFPQEAIFTGYDVVDNDAFHPQAISHNVSPLNNPYFLAVNRFIPKKNISFLLSCYSRYRDTTKSNSWDLVICGDGELRYEIEDKIHALGLEKNVYLPGFLQQNDLVPYFANAQCFIHASTTEQWGLVVNEAMAAGLPVLVSNRCGCFEDLVIEGVNGFGFDPCDQQQLTDLMLKISSGAVDLEGMGQASLQHIRNYSPEYFAQGVNQAIDYALAQP
jgi:1,2-diacylglycerol 3-alpha-glucosyltransferase